MYYCGEKSILFGAFKARTLITVEAQRRVFHFRVNGDIHFALCSDRASLTLHGVLPCSFRAWQGRLLHASHARHCTIAIAAFSAARTRSS
jgi:hypothetical protein